MTTVQARLRRRSAWFLQQGKGKNDLHALFIHSARDWSGTARLFARAARGISEHGAKVSLLVTPDSNVHLAVSPRREPGQPKNTPIPEPFEIIPFASNGFFFSAARRLRRIFRRWDVDVVVVSTDREHLVAATACWLAKNGAVVRWTPAGKLLEMGFSGRWASRLTKTSFLFASETDRHAASLPKNALESAVAEIGVDVAQYPTYTPPEDAAEHEGDETDAPALRFIVCVYDPSSRGRAATAIRTLSMLTPRHPHLRLLIVGAGSDDEDLRMQAAALRVLHLVSFLGERGDEIRIMQDAHLGWVVAEGDTAAYGILDMMALGIPTVASEGGIAERYIAHGISGALYPPDDSAGTAAAVAGLLISDEQREAMGNAARVRVTREFPEERMVKGFGNAINNARNRTQRKR
jgi:glycosyltransferase involved in cell wall biosynthesis